MARNGRRKVHGTVGATGGPLDDVLVRALGHPTRCEILSLLSDQQVASPAEMDRRGVGRDPSVKSRGGRPRKYPRNGNGRQLNDDSKLSHISYHCRALRDFGLVKVVKTRKARGSLEHFYEATTEMLLGYDDWEKLPKSTKERITMSALQETVDRIDQALTARTVDTLNERNVINLGLYLDEDRFKEASLRMHEMMEWLQGLEREAILEFGDDPVRLLPTSASLLLFQAPPPEEPEA